jgi:hypothetical protein
MRVRLSVVHPQLLHKGVFPDMRISARTPVSACSVPHAVKPGRRAANVLAVVVAGLLSACAAPPAVPATPQPAGDAAVQWSRDPAAIVFRAEVTDGRTEGIRERDDIPECTVYGDNRVVWINYTGAFEYEVLYDIVSDARLTEFVNYLAVNAGVYGYQALADSQIPTTSPPVVERLQLTVNDVEHRADSFSGWSPDWFQGVMRACTSLSGTPVLFEPTGAWLTAEELAGPPAAVVLLWEPAASGLDLGEVAASSEPRWITGQNLRALWNVMLNQPGTVAYLQIGEDGVQRNFAVALQIPGVSRVSPRAPAS